MLGLWNKPMDDCPGRWRKFPYRWPIFAFLLLMAGQIMVGCLCTEPAIDPATLLIEISDFPPGWKVCGGGKSRSLAASWEAEEVALIDFCFLKEEPVLYDFTQSREEIYRYCNVSRAAQGYNKLIGGVFLGGEEWWEFPEELRNLNITATQWRAGCMDQWFRGIWYCKFMAQYDEYVVLFTAAISVNGQERIALPKFASIVERIEQKIASRGSLETPSSGD